MASSHIDSWRSIRTAVLAEPRISLAAFLGHPASIALLGQYGLPVPSLNYFRADKALDPNPHGFKLSVESLELKLFMRVLALWGPGALIEAATACAILQMQTQSRCAPEHVLARDNALAAISGYQQSPAEEAITLVQTAAAACAATYARHETVPSSPAASAAWHEIGAPWFAAETIVQDFALTDFDGSSPREACETWGNRVTVWPWRAAQSAAFWSSPAAVIDVVKAALLVSRVA